MRNYKKSILLLLILSLSLISAKAYSEANLNRDFSFFKASMTIEDVKKRLGEPDYQGTLFSNGINQTTLFYNSDINSSQQIVFENGLLVSSEKIMYTFGKNGNGEVTIKTKDQSLTLDDFLTKERGGKENTPELAKPKEDNKKDYKELLSKWQDEGFTDQQIIMLAALDSRRESRITNDGILDMLFRKKYSNMIDYLAAKGFSKDQIVDILLLQAARNSQVSNNQERSSSRPNLGQALGNAFTIMGTPSKTKKYTYRNASGGVIATASED